MNLLSREAGQLSGSEIASKVEPSVQASEAKFARSPQATVQGSRRKPGFLLEKHRYTLMALLSVLILVGSGISLGVGISETRSDLTPSSQSEGFVSGLSSVQVVQSPQVQVNYPININLAPASELELLPGIGPTKAQAIVDYREGQGLFQSKEEIQNVSGIGPKTYEKLKDQITVSSP